MEIIAGTLEFNIEKETAVAIGKFDGIHLGHRRLLDEILAAKKRGLAACVFTFDKSPAALFGKDDRVLTTNEEKHRLFEKMGVDILVEFPLNLETAATPARQFVIDYLVTQMNMKLIVAGNDISFGDKGAGNAELLREMSNECGFDVKIINKVKNSRGEEISSTLVRKYVETGELEKVENLLGMPYSFTGVIEHGNHIGNTIGFPTINIYPQENKLLPPFGVYRSKVMLSDAGGRFSRELTGISNVGCKPTVGGDNKPGIETYIYDFDENVYGREVTVCLYSFMRREQKFSGLDELKEQLSIDIKNGRNFSGYNGILNVYKEAGFTSFDVCAKLRGICKQKKIGHTGTLDPDATGVLPVCLGNATKLCDLLTDHDKEYIAEMLLGKRTDTQDISGKVISESSDIPDENTIINCINSFVGTIEQVPPMYSALKVDGKKLCDLARKGIEVDRASREITIYSIDILEIKLPVVRIKVSCSKGTYIRTLCDDIGEKLGCHATMKSLERTKHSIFKKEDALTLSQIEDLRDRGRLSEVIISVDSIFEDCKRGIVKESSMKLLLNGNVLSAEDFTDTISCEDGERIRVYKSDNSFAGLYRYFENQNLFKPEKMFM